MGRDEIGAVAPGDEERSRFYTLSRVNNIDSLRS
jgi:hypothetical protein